MFIIQQMSPIWPTLRVQAEKELVPISLSRPDDLAPKWCHLGCHIEWVSVRTGPSLRLDLMKPSDPIDPNYESLGRPPPSLVLLLPCPASPLSGKGTCCPHWLPLPLKQLQGTTTRVWTGYGVHGTRRIIPCPAWPLSGKGVDFH